MSVRFEFELSDEDAFTLVDIIQDAKRRALSEVLEAMAQKNKTLEDWWRGHADYVGKLADVVAKGTTRKDGK